jgi:triosephosphate isomerase (TIM)
MTNKYIYFIANWKMFGDIKSLKSINNVANFLKKFKYKNLSKVIYCPPNTLIHLLSKQLKFKHIETGAQNCHHIANHGAHTGFVNPLMLKNVGAKYVIIGHSENRENGESDKLINVKIKTALKSKLNIIFCIGETLKERNNKITKKVLAKQIEIGLKKISSRKNILIAYEPVWAIGTGLIPKKSELLETVSFIKNKVKNIKVLYGGSVNPKNIKDLKNIDIIDGFLIGGASQVPKKFIDIIKKTFI